MFSRLTLFWLCVIAVAGAVLFRTSYQVQELENDLSELEHEIVREQETIRVLRAEWGYLNDLERLETASRRYLPLRPTLPQQFTSLDRIPLRLPSSAPPAGVLMVKAPAMAPLAAAPALPGVPNAPPPAAVTVATSTPVVVDPEEAAVGGVMPQDQRDELRAATAPVNTPIPQSSPVRKPGAVASAVATAMPAAPTSTLVLTPPRQRSLTLASPTSSTSASGTGGRPPRADDQIGQLLNRIGGGR